MAGSAETLFGFPTFQHRLYLLLHRPVKNRVMLAGEVLALGRGDADEDWTLEELVQVALVDQSPGTGLGFNEGAHLLAAQFSSCRPRTLENSRVLLVTSTALTLSACAAISVSKEPIVSPRRSRSARKSP